MNPLQTTAQFSAFVEEIEGRRGYERPLAWAIGRAHLKGNTLLDAWFPVLNYNKNFGTAAVLANIFGHRKGTASYLFSSYEQVTEVFAALAPFKNDGKYHENLELLRLLSQAYSRTFLEKEYGIVVSFLGALDEDRGPHTRADLYLRMQLMSAGMRQPPSRNWLDGAGKFLVPLHWTSDGPIIEKDVTKRRLALQQEGKELTVHSVGQLPSLIDYVTLPQLSDRIGREVLLGACLQENGEWQLPRELEFD